MPPTPDTSASDRVLESLNRLHPKIIDLSLGRVERLLERLGHPERQLPPVVHVAGTNGKGSVVAYLRAMLEADGKRVQVYTSPHLVRFHERIRLSNGPIEEADLLDLLEHCKRANGGDSITFFEITTAAAFLAFSRDPADVLLLEVGLGGRLDATNVIDKPALSVITPIAMDHTQYLGDSIESIAVEKAGILKPGVPAVIGLQSTPVLEVIERRAAEIGAPISVQGRDFVGTTIDDGILVEDEGEVMMPLPGLAGAHQRDNAVLALAAAARLGSLAPSMEARRRGLKEARWPARLQQLRRGPLVGLLPPTWTLWLDGGHNAAAGQALAAWAQAAGEPLHLIYGMMNTKAAEDFLQPLAPLVHSLQAVAIPGEPNSLDPVAAATHARACGIEATPRESLLEAMQATIAEPAKEPTRVLICGSLYLAGRVLADNG